MGLDGYWVNTVLQSAVPEAFFAEVPEAARFDVVVDEAQLLLHGAVGSRRTRAAITDVLQTRVNDAFVRHGATHYVFAFDDRRHVPISKAALQRRRRAAAEASGVAPYSAEESDALVRIYESGERHATLHTDFRRVAATPPLLRRFVALVADCAVSVRMHTHSDAERGLVAAGADDPHTVVVCGAPDVTTATGVHTLVATAAGGDAIERRASLCVGEAEAKCVTHALRHRGRRVLVRCADRDIFAILLLNLHRYGVNERGSLDVGALWLDFRPANASKSAEARYCVDAVALWRGLHRHFATEAAWRDVAYPLETLFFLVALESSDFTPRYRNMGASRWWTAFLRHGGAKTFFGRRSAAPWPTLVAQYSANVDEERLAHVDEAAALRFVAHTCQRAVAAKRKEATNWDASDVGVLFKRMRACVQRGEELHEAEAAAAAKSALAEQINTASAASVAVKTKRNTWPAVPDHDEARARVRQALWTLAYWMNSPLGDTRDPLAAIDGHSLYGWARGDETAEAPPLFEPPSHRAVMAFRGDAAVNN